MAHLDNPSTLMGGKCASKRHARLFEFVRQQDRSAEIAARLNETARTSQHDHDIEAFKLAALQSLTARPNGHA